MELRSNKITFLVTYPSGIWAEDIGSAIKKINEWLGKPIVITCDEVTAVQLPQVIEHACHSTGVESVVFNTRVDDIRSDSNLVFIVDTIAMQVAQLYWGHQVPSFWTKCQIYHIFLAWRENRTLSGLNSGYMLSLMPGKTLMISG